MRWPAEKKCRRSNARRTAAFRSRCCVQWPKVPPTETPKRGSGRQGKEGRKEEGSRKGELCLSSLQKEEARQSDRSEHCQGNYVQGHQYGTDLAARDDLDTPIKGVPTEFSAMTLCSLELGLLKQEEIGRGPLLDWPTRRARIRSRSIYTTPADKAD